jgi:type III pantothenate kinase
MIVLLDVGNSRLKLGWQHPTLGREPVVHAIALTPLTQVPDLLRKWLEALPMRPTEVCGANVAGTVIAEMLEQFFQEIGCPVQWLCATAEKMGLQNRYHNPGQLGADRWAAMLGVAGSVLNQPLDTRPPLVLATFGTATTIDTLGPNLAFEGGLILPGPSLMRQSLAQGTANLPLAKGASNDFPKHTLQAISTGVVAAQAGAVWRQCSVVEKHYGIPPTLCVSGGGWPEVEDEVRSMLSHLEIRFFANPVLDGLFRMTLDR